MNQIAEIIFHLIMFILVAPIIAVAVLNIQWIIIAILSLIGTFMAVEAVKRYTGVS